MTAVEYLEELIECGADLDLIKKSIQQAKEMEKEQKQSEYTRVFDDGYQRKQEQFDYMRGKNHSCQDNFKNSFKHELNKSK